MRYVGAMFGVGAAGFAGSDVLYYLRSYGPSLVVMIFACTPLGALAMKKLPKKAAAVAIPVLILAVLAISTAYLVDGTYNPFLYFRF